MARKELARAEILDCPGCFLFPPRAHRSAGRPGARTPLGGLPHTAARSPGARCAPLGRDVAMLRLSVRWVDRLPINRLVGVGKPGHVICAIAHPRVIREAEKGRCPADGATVNAFARSLRLGIIDLVSHRDPSLDDARHGCVQLALPQTVDIGQNQPVAPYPRGDTPPRTTDHPDLEKGAVRRPRMAL